MLVNCYPEGPSRGWLSKGTKGSKYLLRRYLDPLFLLFTQKKGGCTSQTNLAMDCSTSFLALCSTVFGWSAQKRVCVSRARETARLSQRSCFLRVPFSGWFEGKFKRNPPFRGPPILTHQHGPDQFTRCRWGCLSLQKVKGSC